MEFIFDKQKIDDLTNVSVPIGTEILNIEYLFLKSLKGCPSFIKKLKAKGNDLVDFTGCPKNLIELDVSDNLITNLNKCPSKLKRLDISSNPITSLIGCPEKLQELDCSFTDITNLEGINDTIRVLMASNCNISSIDVKNIPKSLKKMNLSYNKIPKLQNPKELDHCDCDLSFNLNDNEPIKIAKIHLKELN